MIIKQLGKLWYCATILALSLTFPLHPMEGAAGAATTTPTLSRYTASLPRIIEMPGAAVAERICNLLCTFSSGDATQEEPYKMAFIEKIRGMIATGETIKLLLIGFPVKSCNPNKVLSRNLDMADLFALTTLDHMCREIETVYAPGARIILYPHESYMTTINNLIRDVIGVEPYSQRNIDLYQASLHGLIAEHFHEHISIADAIADPLPRYLAQEIGTAMLPTEIFWKCELEPLWMAHKPDALGKKKWENELKSFAHTIAGCYEQQRDQLRRTLIEHYPTDQYIRLSIRAPEDGNIVNKLGIHLIQGKNGTPWQEALGIDTEGHIHLARRDQLAKQGFIPASYRIDGLDLTVMLQQ